MRHHPFVLLTVLASAVASCTGSDDAATTSPQQDTAAVFSLADDDLCERLSADMIAELVEANYDWAGTATATEQFSTECVWELSGTPDVDGLNTVRISSASPPSEPFLDFDDLDGATTTLGVGVRGHPQLSDGVIYSYGGFGYAEFGVPEHGYVEVYLWVPGDEGSEDARFAFADAVIQELGWTP